LVSSKNINFDNNRREKMPTASVEMITKLATDAKAVSAALVKMQKQVAKIDDAETAPHVTTLQTKFDRLNQQIEKIERDAGRKPPILADESDYKNCRKILTNIVKFVQKTAKAVSNEASAAKNEITVQAVSSAEKELLIRDKKLAQALKAVARGDKGRTGPKADGVKQYNHIHIGGNAKDNLLFRPGKKLVLGTLGFHLDSSNSKSEIAKITKVASRSGSKVTLAINGDVITKKK
jgi:hypothetical protein